MGAMTLPDSYMEFKFAQSEAMARAKDAVIEIGKEFGRLTGREYGLMESYRLDDADCAIVVLNSAAGTTKAAVDELRAKGKKVGVLRPRLFRPFPHEEIKDALKNVKAICVLDRADAMNGFGGPLFRKCARPSTAFTSAPKVMGRIFGLGGRDYIG